MNEIALQQPQEITAYQIAFDDNLFHKCHRLAEIMASGACTVPKHLQGKVGDCFAIVGQALRWGFDPYAVAQKTHIVNGTLGYEAQLIIAVINAKAPIIGRLKFDYFGDWSKIKSKEDTSDDVGVVVSAVLKGDNEPTTLSISMKQVGNVRNSPLWTADPRQQLAYLGAKRFARLYFPDVILGIYSEDELQARQSEEAKDITPTKNSGTNAIKERLKAKRGEVIDVQECYDIEPFIEQIRHIETMDEVKEMGQAIKALADDPNVNLCGNDLDHLRQALALQRGEIIYRDLLEKVKKATLENANDIRQELYDNRDKLGEERFAIIDNLLDEHLNNLAN